MGSAVQKVFVPWDCTLIGDYAFADCVGLEYIDLPNVTSIGDHAFQGCPNLTIYTTYDNTYVQNYADAHNIEYECVGQ